MLVGHEPDLSMLVSSLVGRQPDQGMLKSMVVGVKLLPAGKEPHVKEGELRRLDATIPAELRFILDPKTLSWQRA
jgi:hypothetical protein